MLILKDNNKSLYLVSLVVLLTRIPFIFSGFGSEEDAWGLILTARNISLTGIYEVSRMPGHPVQELLLSLIYMLPSWFLNLLTAIISTLGVLFFMFTLREWKIRNVIPAGLALAFVPVFYINSTNIMDYTWTLSLVMLSMYFVVKRNIIIAGVILGIACGFRITAGAMVIPFAALMFIQDRNIMKCVLLGFITSAVALICYIPAWNVYGLSFFTYYEYFPYPPILKNVYKATLGAWGVVGVAAVLAAAVAVGSGSKKRRVRDQSFVGPTSFKAIVWMCVLTILLYTYSFLKIPQKSAFVLPMVPFIILLFALLLGKKQITRFALAMIISSFFAGINLDNPLRGSSTSSLAYPFSIGNTPVSFDLLSGPVLADYSKRKQKIEYAKTLVESFASIKERTLIIAGWWENEINYFSLANKNPLVTYVYYIDEKELIDFQNQHYKIYYLPEQDYYNDLRFQGEFTKRFAKEW